MKKSIIVLLTIAFFTACSTQDKVLTPQEVALSKLTKQDSLLDYNFEAKLYLVKQDSTQNTIIPRPVPHEFIKEVGYIVRTKYSMSLYTKNKEKLISQFDASEPQKEGTVHAFRYPTVNQIEYENSTSILVGNEKRLMHFRLLKDFKTYDHLVFEESYPIINGTYTSNWFYSTYNYEIVKQTEKTHK